MTAVAGARPAPTTPANDRAARDMQPRRLALVLVLPGLYYLAVLLYHGINVVLFPYDLDYGEGYVLNDAARLLRGEPIYTDVTRFPMVRSPYPPLVPALTAPLLALVGPSFLPGRLLSFVAVLATAALVYLGARRLTGDRLLAWLAASVYLGSPQLYQWAPFQRVDALAVLLTAGAVLSLRAATPPAHAALRAGAARPSAEDGAVDSPRRALLAGLLAALALLAKQTMVAAPAAIGLYLLLTRRRLLVPFLVALTLPLVLVGGGLMLVSEGRFADHVIFGNSANPYNLNRLLRFQYEFLSLHLIAAGAALAWGGVGLLRRRPTLLGLYALAAFGVSLSVANEGSSVNYFLEFLPAACLAAAEGAAAFIASRGRALDREFVLVLASLQLSLLVHFPNLFGVWVSPFPPHGDTPVAADQAVGAHLDALVRATPGDLLLEPAGFAVRNGREVFVQPIDLRAEQVRGRWRPDDLVAAIAGHRFSLVVLSFRLLPHEALAAIEAHYTLVEELRGPGGLPYRVYRPAGAAPIMEGGDQPSATPGR